MSRAFVRTSCQCISVERGEEKEEESWANTITTVNKEN
jgi:hypothetical protein